MESLAALVVLLILAVLGSPVLALLALQANWHWPAALLACVAMCAGMHWLVHVTTLARLLGLLAVLLGAYVLWHVSPALS